MDYSLSLILFAFSTAITPGPNNLMILSSGLNYGIRKSIPHIMGICFGLTLMVVFIGAGLGTIFDLYPITHFFIKTIGILYLLYLARCIAMAGNPEINNGKSKPLTFFQAAAFQWLNPKAWIIFIGAVSAFTNTEANLVVQIAFITVVLLITGFISLNIWLWFGVSMTKIIQTDKHRRYFNISMALVLVVSIVPIALTDFS